MGRAYWRGGGGVCLSVCLSVCLFVCLFVSKAVAKQPPADVTKVFTYGKAFFPGSMPNTPDPSLARSYSQNTHVCRPYSAVFDKILPN